MLSNFIKLSLRNLLKYKFTSLIHVIGLGLGLACFLLIDEYLSFEKSFDNFHDQPEQLYRLTTANVVNGQLKVMDAMSFAPSGPALKEEIPEILEYTTTYKTWRMVFRKDGQAVEEEWVTAVDSNFLKLFRYEVKEGKQEDFFSDPYNIVLTEAMAAKYFGAEPAIGKEIYVLGDFNRPFRVTGVLKDIPKNTHYKFDMLVSLSSFQERILSDAWRGFNYYTYLLLDKSADPERVQAKLSPLSKKYLNDETTLVFRIQPVTDIHLHSDYTFEPETHGSAKAVYFLGIISLLILLIAWVNYINLSTARALERAKEVGLRKVIGATRSQLISQFFTEATLINFFGALLALILALVAMPFFNELVGKPILSDLWMQPSFLLKIFAVFALGTLITGFYPALVLSSFKPIQTLQGSYVRSRTGIMLRKGLVIFQFAASIGLVVAALVVYQQIDYLTGRQIGISIDRVIGVNNPNYPPDQRDAYLSKYKSFLFELEQLENVQKVGSISSLPGGGSADISSNSGGIRIVGLTDRVEATVYIATINDQLQEALDINLIAGRNFNRDYTQDTSAVIVNKSLLKMLQIAEEPSVINEYIQFGRDPQNDKYQIVGVFDDYHRSSMKNTVEPTLFFFNEMSSRTVVKLGMSPIPATIVRIQQLWFQFFPQSPFSYTPLDTRYERLYLEEVRLGKIFSNFAFLAIIVALLGLSGLSSFISIQRTKEVGIRKILGASPAGIVFLFFKDFLMLIIMAVLIGLPIVYLAMNDWLNGFAYRIHFPWWVMGFAILVITFLAFVTVGFQTYKTATINPSKTLRHD